MNGNPEGEVRQIVVHPAMWNALEEWLYSRGVVLAYLSLDDSRGILRAHLPLNGDDIPTYVMGLEMNPQEAFGE